MTIPTIRFLLDILDKQHKADADAEDESEKQTESVDVKIFGNLDFAIECNLKSLS